MSAEAVRIRENYRQDSRRKLEVSQANVSQAPSPSTDVIKNVVWNLVEQSDRKRSFIIHGAAEDEETLNSEETLLVKRFK